VHRDWARAGTIAAILVLFVAGVAIGEIVEPWGGRRGHALVLGCEAMALALGAALHWPGAGSPTFVSLFPLVFAMGLQNATMHRAGGVSIGLTYVTGTLVQVGRALAGQHDRRQMAKYLALWLSLAIGAGLGALMLSVSMFALLLAATMAAGVLAATAAFGRR
ncbi:MAG TPA: YoaK family protein, partial [Rhodopila sp.]